ncbi:hypothetical protein [Inmirania thermothiophila]|uniref:Nickel-dependent hydrogenase n=1 Tax=Inmirania thermothiophila TaxID=1750597 RepID=A0A3N1Y1Y2_9GAMM|nr:hypothetical protein [Inmirania thermothiophila]ROR32531.1 hypothetical protein EDC57_1733 [Inmirania thermothiophila]
MPGPAAGELVVRPGAREPVVYCPPLGGGRGLAGLAPEAARARVERLFAVCGAGQGVALAAACDAAAGAPWAVRPASPRQHLEWLRALALSLLAAWPRRLGLAPEAALARAVLEAADAGAVAGRLRGPLVLEAVRRTGEWPAHGPLAALGEALEAEAAPPAAEAAWPRFGRAEAERRLGGAVPAQSGPLARQRAAAGVRRRLLAAGGGVAARVLAQAVELARLAVEGPWPQAVASWRLGPGRGVALVETARGLLVHEVALAGGRIRRYRIVAPTEGNLHPRGAVAAALARLGPAAAGRLVAAVDPCVPWRMEQADA